MSLRTEGNPTRDLAFHTLDVFTERRFGGNPLAVVLDADELDGSTMQRIAREFNLSETVFVLRPRRAEALSRLRIFTPFRELPFAGHPTVGTACLLYSLGTAPAAEGTASFVLEEEVGAVPVTVVERGGRPPFACFTTARLPEAGPSPPGRTELAAALGLVPEDVLDDDRDRPEAFSAGVPYLFVPLAGRAALGRAQPVAERARAVLGAYWAPEVFVFCREPELAGSDLRGRMFAPELGIAEDPATGSAAAALAGYLAVRSERRDGTLRWVLEQGFEMGRPSLLEIEADVADGALRAVRVGGSAVRVADGTLRAGG